MVTATAATTERPVSLYGWTLDELEAFFKDTGQPVFRARQLMQWLYRKRVQDFAAMTNLPKTLQTLLAERFVLQAARPVLARRSSDVTEKLLLELEDRQSIETVLIRYPQQGVGAEGSRKTLCVSSQVGCAYGCKFCASGLAGWKRHLSAAEIVGQFVYACQIEDEREAKGRGDTVPLDNVVFMGMGEPLANYDNVLRAIRILNADWGPGFGARRITISTSGLVPQILALADEPIQFRLAVSLHGATDEVRQQIMPINRKYPLAQLLPAIARFREQHGRMVTLEYILIEGVNDALEQAEHLARIARDLHAHVNLIPYNRVEGLDWVRPSLARQQRFARVLEAARVSHTIRKEKGHDIDAACGQLRLQTERSRVA